MAVQNDVVLRRKLQINTDESRFYTESMITLYYTNNEHKPLKTFVANWVGAIRIHTNPRQWFHVKSEHIIANMACRGVLCCCFSSVNNERRGLSC